MKNLCPANDISKKMHAARATKKLAKCINLELIGHEKKHN